MLAKAGTTASDLNLSDDSGCGRRPPLPLQDPRHGKAGRRRVDVRPDTAGDSRAGAGAEAVARHLRSQQREGRPHRHDRGDEADPDARRHQDARRSSRTCTPGSSPPRGRPARTRCMARSAFAGNLAEILHVDGGDVDPDHASTTSAQAAQRISGRVLRTPLRRSEWLSDVAARRLLQARIAPADVLLQDPRRVQRRPPADRGTSGAVEQPLVTASAGNHGRALAYAAVRSGLPLIGLCVRTAPRVEARRHPRAPAPTCARAATTTRPSDRRRSMRRSRRRRSTSRRTRIPTSSPEPGRSASRSWRSSRMSTRSSCRSGGGGLISGIAHRRREARRRRLESSASKSRRRGRSRRASPPDGSSRSTSADARRWPRRQPRSRYHHLRHRAELVPQIVLWSRKPSLQTRWPESCVDEHLIVEGAGAAGVAALLVRQDRVERQRRRGDPVGREHRPVPDSCNRLILDETATQPDIKYHQHDGRRGDNRHEQPDHLPLAVPRRAAATPTARRRPTARRAPPRRCAVPRRARRRSAGARPDPLRQRARDDGVELRRQRRVEARRRASVTSWIDVHDRCRRRRGRERIRGRSASRRAIEPSENRSLRGSMAPPSACSGRQISDHRRRDRRRWRPASWPPRVRARPPAVQRDMPKSRIFALPFAGDHDRVGPQVAVHDVARDARPPARRRSGPRARARAADSSAAAHLLTQRDAGGELVGEVTDRRRLADVEERGDVRMRERRRRVRARRNAAVARLRPMTLVGTSFSATVRPTLVSRARYTSPSPPSPMRSSRL